MTQAVSITNPANTTRCSFCGCESSDLGLMVQGLDPSCLICERCLRDGLECLVLARRQVLSNIKIPVSFSRDSSAKQTG